MWHVRWFQTSASCVWSVRLGAFPLTVFGTLEILALAVGLRRFWGFGLFGRWWQPPSAYLGAVFSALGGLRVERTWHIFGAPAFRGTLGHALDLDGVLDFGFRRNSWRRDCSWLRRDCRLHGGRCVHSAVVRIGGPSLLVPSSPLTVLRAVSIVALVVPAPCVHSCDLGPHGLSFTCLPHRPPP